MTQESHLTARAVDDLRKGGPAPRADRRHAPNYPISEAARYLLIPPSTIRWWCLGQAYPTAGGPKRAKPVISIPPGTPPALSFVNLVELHVLDAIRHQYRVSLPAVRAAVAYLTRHFESRHPLAEEQFETDGVDLFVEKYGRLINASREGQRAMRELLRAHLQRLERDATGLPIRLYPFTRRDRREAPRAVVIDPARSFGRPLLAKIGAATSAIAERYKAGESIDALAADYDCGHEDIEEAVRCELSLAAA